MPRHLAAALLLALPACSPAGLDDIRPARIRVGWSVALPVVPAPGVMPGVRAGRPDGCHGDGPAVSCK